MSRQEVIHRNVLSTRLLQPGYNVFLPVYDEGIDLIAHRESDDDVRLIQQKSRWGMGHLPQIHRPQHLAGLSRWRGLVSGAA